MMLKCIFLHLIISLLDQNVKVGLHDKLLKVHIL